MQLPVCRVYEQKEECCLGMPWSDFIAGLQYSWWKRGVSGRPQCPQPHLWWWHLHTLGTCCPALQLPFTEMESWVIQVKDSVTKTIGDKSFDARKHSIMFLTKRKQCPVFNSTLTANPGTAAMVQWHAITREQQERGSAGNMQVTTENPKELPDSTPCIYHLVEKQTEGEITVKKWQIKS